MNSGETLPERAQCLSCGYLLRGLPDRVCPECAREFEPADPSTFDADPRKRRRRRLLIRGAAILSILAIAVAFFPRGILKADVTFTCSRCNRSITVTRWQLNPPSWISFAYPGINSRDDSTATPAAPVKKNCDHRYDSYSIRSDLPIGGRVTGSGVLQPPQLTKINGVVLTIDTAPRVLRALLKPGNYFYHMGQGDDVIGTVQRMLRALLKARNSGVGP